MSLSPALSFGSLSSVQLVDAKPESSAEQKVKPLRELSSLLAVRCLVSRVEQLVWRKEVQRESTSLVSGPAIPWAPLAVQSKPSVLQNHQPQTMADAFCNNCSVCFWLPMKHGSCKAVQTLKPPFLCENPSTCIHYFQTHNAHINSPHLGCDNSSAP